MDNKRKGATLAEICVVLAVISVISLSVTSFVAMTSHRGAAASAKLAAMTELEMIESLADQWFSVVQNSGGEVEIQEGKLLSGLPEGFLCVEGNILEMLAPGGSPMTQMLTAIEKIQWEEVNKTDRNGNVVDTLYFCTVAYSYKLSGKAVSQTYVFCVNPRVGETVALPIE